MSLWQICLKRFSSNPEKTPNVSASFIHSIMTFFLSNKSLFTLLFLSRRLLVGSLFGGEGSPVSLQVSLAYSSPKQPPHFSLLSCHSGDQGSDCVVWTCSLRHKGNCSFSGAEQHQPLLPPPENEDIWHLIRAALFQIIHNITLCVVESAGTSSLSKSLIDDTKFTSKSLISTEKQKEEFERADLNFRLGPHDRKAAKRFGVDVSVMFGERKAVRGCGGEDDDDDAAALSSVLFPQLGST